MLQVNVALPSGRSEDLLVSESSKVEDLKILAQKTLGHKFLRLITSEGRFVDAEESVAGLHDGKIHLTAISLEAKLSATGRAFALWCQAGDGVLTWGDPEFGAVSSEVQSHLKNLQQVQASFGAFAAILGDGSVVTWGVQIGAVTAQQSGTS